MIEIKVTNSEALLFEAQSDTLTKLTYSTKYIFIYFWTNSINTGSCDTLEEKKKSDYQLEPKCCTHDSKLHFVLQRLLFLLFFGGGRATPSTHFTFQFLCLT